MLNLCQFIGRLGRDPELKHTASGSAVCNFSIACSEKYKDKSGEQQEKTEWVNVVIWGKLADIAGQYLQKGSLVYVSGKLTTRKWQDQDGKDRYTTEITVFDMKMLDSRKSDIQDQQRESRGNHYVPPTSTGEDVPF